MKVFVKFLCKNAGCPVNSIEYELGCQLLENDDMTEYSFCSHCKKQMKRKY